MLKAFARQENIMSSLARKSSANAYPVEATKTVPRRALYIRRLSLAQLASTARLMALKLKQTRACTHPTPLLSS